jgi:tetratricopeptide (TPR) repeat protein
MAGGPGVTAPDVAGSASREQIEAELLKRARHGYSLQQQGNLAEAEKIYREVLAVDESHFHATHLLGVVAAQVRAFEPAAELISRAISINPNDAVAHSNLGNVLMELQRYDEALASHRRAIALDPNYPFAYSNQANVLRELGRFDEALASCDQAIALQPDYAEAWSNRAGALTELRRFDEAIASYDRATALNPGLLNARLNKANLNLALGDLEGGWPDYELRMFKPDALTLASFDQPPWLGEADLRGRSILVHAEQGLGDTIQFCR